MEIHLKKDLNLVLTSRPFQFFISKEAGHSSMFEPNNKFLSQFPQTERFKTVDEIPITAEKVTNLDKIIKNNNIEDIDFIKLDTEGSELFILEGSKNYVLPKTFGLNIEVEFTQIYKDQPLFRDVDKLLDEGGFQLMDLRRAFWKRKDYHDYVGKGQLIFGDALYFKKIDVLKDELLAVSNSSLKYSKIYKCILTCMVYRMFDYAMSLANMGFEEDFLDKESYYGLIVVIEKASKNGVLPNFWGKKILHKIFNRITEILKPSSYLGWADGDRFIGNIRDK